MLSIQSKFIFIAIIITVGLCIYGNTLGAEFQFDDIEYIVKNPAIRDVMDVKAIYNARPVPARFMAFFSFALNYHVHQLHVYGYHLINLFIHMMNTFLVYTLLMLIVRAQRLEGVFKDDEKHFFCMSIALLFLVHPIQTQAVTYITQRFTSLATLFYLLSLIIYFKARSGGEKRGKVIGIYLCLCILSGLCGMMTKQIVMTLPVMIVICEGYFLQNSSEITIRKIFRWRYLGILCFLLIIPSYYAFDAGRILFNQLASSSHEGDLITSSSYLLTQFRVISKYIQLLIFPIGQNLDYDFAISKSLFSIKTFISFLFLIGIAGCAFIVRKAKPLISFGITWFLITLSVESSIIPIKHVIFEHRMYLPSVGLLMAIGFLVWTVIKDAKKYIIYVCVVAAILSVLTFQRNKVWQTQIALWEDVTKKSPNKSRAYLNLGKAYLDKGDGRLALMNLNKAIQIKPNSHDAYNFRGLLLYRQGLLSMAIDDFTQALAINPKLTAALVNRGNVYRKIGHYERALEDYNLALDIRDTDYRTYVNRGNVYAKMRLFDAALKDYFHVVKLNPYYVDIYKNIGNVYEIEGRYALALAEYQKVLEHSPEDVDAHIFIGTVYSRLNQKDEAITAFSRALQNNPQRSDAYYKRSLLYYAQQEYKLAHDDIVRAQYLGHKVDPKYLTRLNRTIGK